MNRLTTLYALAGALVGLGLAGSAQATIILPNVNVEIVATGSTSFTVGQTGATASFDVRVTGMQNGGLSLSTYDFGIAYDPALMTLTNFSGFTGALGDEGGGCAQCRS